MSSFYLPIFVVRFTRPWPSGTYGDHDTGGSGGWEVYLPHQCDEWAITASYDWETQEDAIRSLEDFLEDGRRALGALRAGTEYG